MENIEVLMAIEGGTRNLLADDRNTPAKSSRFAISNATYMFKLTVLPRKSVYFLNN